ncbi:MAG TPA: phosphatase PAP2 family protein [Fontimonas sp.]
MVRFVTATARSVLIAALLCLHCGSATGMEDELPGDIVTGLMPLAAYGLIKYKDDDEGEGQFLRSVGFTLLINSSLRYALKDTDWSERPNGSPYGFPSGHAGFVVSNAAFLSERYGWKYGLPAYAASAYVMYVRVDTDHHRWRDVIAGGLLAYGLSHLFVTPVDATHIAPVVGPDYLGIRLGKSF